jgi:hypothetical protein
LTGKRIAIILLPTEYKVPTANYGPHTMTSFQFFIYLTVFSAISLVAGAPQDESVVQFGDFVGEAEFIYTNVTQQKRSGKLFARACAAGYSLCVGAPPHPFSIMKLNLY